MINKPCVFCTLEPSRIIAENDLAVAIRDIFPVTEYHTLIIPRRHVADYFDLTPEEHEAIRELLTSRRESIQKADNTVTGFNVGVNCGADAGQTIFHVHVHLIPRRKGDVENPKGGVRGVIPAKQGY